VERDDTPRDLHCATAHCEGDATRGLGCIEGRRDLHGNLVHSRQFGGAVYGAATGHVKILELPLLLLMVPLGGAVLSVLSLLFSFPITVPVSLIVATCAYPFLRWLQGAGRKAFGIAGFLVGSLVWLGM